MSPQKCCWEMQKPTLYSQYTLSVIIIDLEIEFSLGNADTLVIWTIWANYNPLISPVMRSWTLSPETTSIPRVVLWVKRERSARLQRLSSYGRDLSSALTLLHISPLYWNDGDKNPLILLLLFFYLYYIILGPILALLSHILALSNDF
jgi:hypothetical protein